MTNFKAVREQEFGDEGAALKVYREAKNKGYVASIAKTGNCWTVTCEGSQVLKENEELAKADE